MRRIEFLAPVKSMRGNLSGAQELKYPTKDNKAWDAPSDKRSYATNYNTRYIGSKRSSDELNYFNVRNKSAVTMSPAMRTGMALLAASSDITRRIMKNISTISQLQTYFEANGGASRYGSFKKWIISVVRNALKTQTDIFFNAPGKASIIFGNPYLVENVPTAIAINYPQELLVKFWKELAQDGEYFYVDGMTGLCVASFADWGDFFKDFSDTKFNVLGIRTKTISEIDYVCIGAEGREQYLLSPTDEYVLVDGPFIIDGKYTTITTAPA